MKTMDRLARLCGLAATAAAALALAQPAGAATGYADPLGDAGTAPDIGAVSVTNSPEGQITFQIAVPSQPELAADAKIGLFLDTDRNGSTGFVDAGGIEYVFVLDGASHTYGFGRWNGSTFEPAPSSTVSVSYSSGAVISVNRSELGNTSGLGFWARALKGQGSAPGTFDDAPDKYMWGYLPSIGQSGSYVDPAGDSGTAPDIGTVSVSNNETGQIAFQIDTNGAELPSGTGLLLFLDTDQNPGTGSVGLGGVEYVFAVDGTEKGYGFGRWNGSEFDFSTPSSTVSVFAGNGLAIWVNRSELEGTSGFNFWVGTVEGSEPLPGRFDKAPDLGGWGYQLAGAPTAPVTPPAAVKLSVVRLFTRPVSPVPGGVFNVFAEVRRSDTGADLLEGTVSCRAAIAGKPVRAVAAGFVKGTPQCSFRIPQATAGKTLAGSIAVSFNGAQVSKSFAFKVAARKRRVASLAPAALQPMRLAAPVVDTALSRGHAVGAPAAALSASTFRGVPFWLGLW